MRQAKITMISWQEFVCHDAVNDLVNKMLYGGKSTLYFVSLKSIIKHNVMDIEDVRRKRRTKNLFRENLSMSILS